MIKIINIMTTRLGNTGISKSVMNIEKNIDHTKHEMEYVFSNNPPEEYKALLHRNNSSYYVIEGRNRHPLRYYRELIKLLSNKKYDIVHAHGNSHTLSVELTAAKKANIPVRIAHSHSTSTRFSLLHKALTKQFNKAVTYGFSSSIDAGNWLFKDDEFTVIPNGIEVNKYKFSVANRVKIRKNLNITDEDIIIGHVGMFTRNKNQQYLIRLLSELRKLNKNYKLLLVGEGEYLEKCKQLVKNLKLQDKVVFYGESNEVEEIYSAMDIFIMPSFNEGFGLVLVEAQANNLKCFASDTIPVETNISGNLTFLNLNMLETIIESINRYGKDSNEKRNNSNSYSTIYNSIYNIKTSVKKIEAKYAKLLKEYENAG